MDESALRNLRDCLEASRSSLHVLLDVFTVFVVFGLLVELFVLVKEFRDDRKDFRYGRVRPYEIHLPKRPNVRQLLMGLVGTALIAAGVTGELYVVVKVTKLETEIRSANDQLYVLVNQKAGDAAQSAKTAHDEADRADQTAR